jgi:hypothetical protein
MHFLHVCIPTDSVAQFCADEMIQNVYILHFLTSFYIFSRHSAFSHVMHVFDKVQSCLKPGWPEWDDLSPIRQSFSFGTFLKIFRSSPKKFYIFILTKNGV